MKKSIASGITSKLVVSLNSLFGRLISVSLYLFLCDDKYHEKITFKMSCFKLSHAQYTDCEPLTDKVACLNDSLDSMRPDQIGENMF